MTDQDQLQEKIIAGKIVALLDESSQDLDAATLARLAASRKQAVAAMGQAQHVALLQPVMVGWSAGWHQLQQLSHHAGYRFWLPVILLLAAVVAMFGNTLNRQGQYNIDTDSLLLASELPPEAYADKEFVAWLEATSRQ
jgi:hypothetical protein